MSQFNLKNISAVNFQNGNGNQMNTFYNNSNIIQWNVLESEFQRLLEEGKWNSEQIELLKEGEKSVKQRDSVKLRNAVKKFSSELLLQFAKTALSEIIKGCI